MSYTVREAEILAHYMARLELARQELNAARLVLDVDKYTGTRGIIARVALAYNVSFEDVVSQKRTRGYARRKHPDLITPRQVAMYIARTMTTRSLAVIGRTFNRDHTTVLHGYQKIGEMIEKDPEFKAKVESIMDSIREAAKPVADLAA